MIFFAMDKQNIKGSSEATPASINTGDLQESNIAKPNDDSCHDDAVQNLGSNVASIRMKGRKSRECSTTLQAKWDEMFSRLVEYHEKHGNCLGTILSSPLSVG